MSCILKKDIMKRLKEHYEAAAAIVPKDRIVGIFLQGSQNYGMGTDKSDIDTKCIIVPSLEDIIFNKSPISTTHILPNDEHIDIKDIRLIFNNFRKQNINYIEILFTKYFILNPQYKKLWNELVEDREAIAKYNPYTAVKAIKGMAMDKYHALEHPYPNKAEVLAQYGFDPKQLHHLVRLYYFLGDYIMGAKTYAEILRPTGKRKYDLLDLKCGGDPFKQEYPMSLEDAREWGKTYFDGITQLADIYCDLHSFIKSTPNSCVDKLFDKIQTEIMKKAMKKDLRRKKDA